MTTVERIRRQFQDALGGLELRVLLEQLEGDLSSLSLKELGQFLQSPAARSVASVPASVLLNFVADSQAPSDAPSRKRT